VRFVAAVTALEIAVLFHPSAGHIGTGLGRLPEPGLL